MSTRKIILIVVGVMAVLCLIVALFVGGIAWFVFHTIGTSEAADTARAYLRNNQTLKQDIGEVQKFGNIVTAAINDRNGNSEVTLKLKVFGEHKTVNATVDLMLVQGNTWRVTSASYVNSNGENVKLLDPYDTKVLVPRLAA